MAGTQAMKETLRLLLLVCMSLFAGCDHSPRGVGAKTPVPPALPPMSEAEQLSAAEGAKVFERIRTVFPAMKLDTWGGLGSRPKLAIWMPALHWHTLPRDERESLGFFMRSKIPEVRSKPEAFLRMSPTAPAYPVVLGKLRMLYHIEWIIGIGTLNADGSLLLGDVVAQGSERPWAAPR